jgi:hypothetical protein
MTPRTYWLSWLIWTAATLVAVRLFLVRPLTARLDALLAAISSKGLQ